jgi:hypothetical protein
VSDSAPKTLGIRILLSIAALATMVMTTAAAVVFSRGVWSVVFPVVVGFPYLFLILRLITHSDLTATDRGLSRGLGWTHIALFTVYIVSVGVFYENAVASVYYAILLFASPYAIVGIPFFACQILLIRADGQSGIGREFWAGFAIPWACAAATFGGIYTDRDLRAKREAQRLEEAARPAREAAEARARALQQLPRGDIAWEVDLPGSPITPSAVAMRQGVNGAIEVATNLGTTAVTLYQGAQSLNATAFSFTSAPSAWRTDGVRFGDLAITSDGTTGLKAVDSRGRTRWSAGFPGRYSIGAVAAGETLVVASLNNLILAIDRDGTTRWRFDVHAVTDEETISTQVSMGDGFVYVARRREVIALREDGRLAWVFRLNPGEHTFIYSASLPTDRRVVVVVADFTKRPRARFAVLRGPV